MTESQINELRKELIRLTPRLASASAVLLITIEKSIREPAITSAANGVREALSDYADWVRRAASEEDLAKLGDRGQGPERRSLAPSF